MRRRAGVTLLLAGVLMLNGCLSFRPRSAVGEEDWRERHGFAKEEEDHGIGSLVGLLDLIAK